jgi:hypothetical protein
MRFFPLPSLRDRNRIPPRHNGLCRNSVRQRGLQKICKNDILRRERGCMNGEAFYRELLKRSCDSFPAYPEGRYRGRGIVLCAGGPTHLSNAYVCLKFLRSFTDLPVELFYAGEIEMPPAVRHLFRLDFAPITVVDITLPRFREEHPFLTVRSFRGYQIKPYALLNCSFEEILYIDVDNIPLQSPESLFAAERYRETGALFWPDLVTTRSTSDELFRVFGVTADVLKRDLEFESGQIVLDKRRCWKALLTTCLANSDVSDFRDYCYLHTLGDKDTFRLAFQYAGQPYHLVQHRSLQTGSRYVVIPIPLTTRTFGVQHDLGSFFATGILQHDPDGRPLFAHKTMCEWNMYQHFRNFMFIESADGTLLDAVRLADLEDRGYGYLEEFRQRYMEHFRREYLREFQGLLAKGIIFLLNIANHWRTGNPTASSQQ